MATSVLFSKTGPFSIPEEVELQFFKQYPPHTSVGTRLFQKQNTEKFSEDLKTLQSSETLHWGYLILEKRPVCEGYQQLKVRTIYSYPLLTSEPESIEASEASFWSSYIQNEAGDIFSYSLEDSEYVRVCRELQTLLKDGGWMKTHFNILSIPEGATWDVEEDEHENEKICIHWPIEQILKELLNAVDPTRLSTDCLAVTRNLIEGRVSITEILS